MKKYILSTLFMLLFSGGAYAHNSDAVLQGFYSGFIHPVTGWDHLLMMVGVGLMAAQSEGRTRWLLPATFIGMVLLGGVFGVATGAFGQLELLIAVTILLAGAALMLNQVVSNRFKLALAALFALPHGWAHGMEIGMQGSSTLLGILIATVALHAVGYALIKCLPLFALSINRLYAYMMLIAGSVLLLS